MIPLLKDVGKSLVLNIPSLRERYFQREFLNRAPCCKGSYPSFAGALAAAPAEKLSGYNHRSIAEFYKKSLGNFNPGDYPVLFWLARILPAAQLVFELGGSIGSGYYAYRRFLPFPPELRWIICDVPETVRLGKEIARERNENQLAFTDRREAAGNPDIYATFGTLQYIEEPFAQIIGQLNAKPPHLLINRVPFCEGPAFITLQNNGSWFSPYQVQNKSDFIQSITALGYELVDQWKVNRLDSFLLPLGQPMPSYHGIYFRLKS
jgi:putative methyltransferase (TIGR04325 family)